MATLAEKIKAFLIKAWNESPDSQEENSSSRYAPAIATQLVVAMDLVEKTFGNVFGRLGKLETAVTQLIQLVKEQRGEAPVAPTNGAAAATAEGGANGHVMGETQTPEPPAPEVQMSPPLPAKLAAPPRGKVRVDSMGNPLSPSEQHDEETMDMGTLGYIDGSRYVDASRFQ